LWTTHARGILGQRAIQHEHLQSPKYKDFDTYYDEFKRACGRYRAGFKGGGENIIDFMDHEPLRRAFRNNVDPVALAKEFAENFDIEKFGRK
jgi:hypothetical protein